MFRTQFCCYQDVVFRETVSLGCIKVEKVRSTSHVTMGSFTIMAVVLESVASKFLLRASQQLGDLLDCLKAGGFFSTSFSLIPKGSRITASCSFSTSSTLFTRGSFSSRAVILSTTCTGAVSAKKLLRGEQICTLQNKGSVVRGKSFRGR